ncbi:MAG: outer membrane protein transport protein [Kofleriaceae bacterium]
MKRVFAVVIAVVLARDARASTLDLFGFGMRSPALAGTGAATADDYESVYANPAGLADAHTKRATVGVVVADFRTKMDGDIVGDSGSGTVLGGVVPMPLGGWAKDRIGLGFGFHIPNDTLNRVRAPFPGVPQFALLENRSHVIAIQLAVGVKLTDRLSVGAGVIVLAALRGGIDVTTDAGGRFSADSEQRLTTQFAPVVGARWHASPRLSYGLVVRAPVRSDYDIKVTSDLGDAIPLTLPEIRIAGNAQYDPLSVAAEAAWRWRPDLLLVGQVEYQHWSAYPLPTKNPVPATLEQQPPGFHDRPVPRIGAEWTARTEPATMFVRAGYSFLWSPAPEMTGQQSLLDNNRHLVGVGFGLVLTGKLPLRVDIYGQLHHLQARSHVKDPDLQQPGKLPVFDSISTSGNVLVTGAAVGIDL